MRHKLIFIYYQFLKHWILDASLEKNSSKYIALVPKQMTTVTDVKQLGKFQHRAAQVGMMDVTPKPL